MNIWLHRISHCNDFSYKLLEEGYISIGFSVLSNNEFLDKSVEGDKNFFKNEYKNVIGNLNRSRYSLWRFLSEFKEKDQVLIPMPLKFSICDLVEEPMLLKDVPNLQNIFKEYEVTIKDNRVYLNNNCIDIGFVWKCKLVEKDIMRKDVFDRKLISRMKILQTNANITDLKENIKEVVKIHNSKETYNLHDEIIDKMSQPINDIIMNKLNPDKFEMIIKWYLKEVGASDVYIPSKNEGGKENGADADIVATFENLKIIIYVQAKYHKGETSTWAVEQIQEYKDQKENMDDEYTYISWVITSAKKFNEEAVEKAREQGVRLININEFVKMLIDSGFNNINEAFI